LTEGCKKVSSGNQLCNRSDPSVIGSVFNLNDKPFTVVGITPPGFFGDTLLNDPPDFFLPLATENDDVNKPDTHWFRLDRPHPARREAHIHRG
jgi:hypothetical protein